MNLMLYMSPPTTDTERCPTCGKERGIPDDRTWCTDKWHQETESEEA